MNSPRHLVAVVVTYNRLEKFQVALRQSLENDFYKIVVINNASTDGTAEWLNTLEDDRLQVIHSESNLGGAGGFKIGFQHVAENIPEADWLVCFDDDAYPRAGMADCFSSLEIPADVGSLAAAVYLPSGGISEMNRPSRNPFWHLRELLGVAVKGRHGFHMGDETYAPENGVIDIDASSFVGFFVRVDLIREGRLGLPRGELFIYADDIIYSLDVRRAGLRHLFAPQLQFEHDCETLVEQKQVYKPLWKAYYTFRNGLEMYRVASGWWYPLVLLVKVPMIFATARHYHSDERATFLRLTRTAIWDGLKRDYSKTLPQVIELSK